MPRDERFSEQYALDKAIQSFEAEVEQTGRLVAKNPPPEEYPLSRWVVRVREASWRHVDDFLGCRGVVYDLPGPAGARASLYVVAREDIGDLDTSPTLHPFTTAGCCAAAWQEDGLLYVLVVQGDPSIYGGYLNLPRSPVA